MTAVKVVDASALAAILFGEPEGEFVTKWLGGARLVAPGLLGFELANVCLMKCRRHPEQRTAFLVGFQQFPRFGIEELAVDPQGALALALETGLTAYDASYLLLARQLNAELVTLDKALARAMTSGG